jgi:hypothetical protein
MIVLTNEKGAVLELSGRQIGWMVNADLSHEPEASPHNLQLAGRRAARLPVAASTTPVSATAK